MLKDLIINFEEIPGDYQKENINTAYYSNRKNWNISNEEINSGIENVKINTGLRGRWQIISNEPLIICDTGHNIDGLTANSKSNK